MMSSSDYDNAYQEALKKAVEEAKKKAEILAGAAGKRLGDPASITEGYQDTSARYRDANMYMEKAAMAEEAEMDMGMGVMPGELEIRASVTVTYVLAD